MNRKKLHKLIYTPKLYFKDGQKNRRKKVFKSLELHRPFFEKNLRHVNKLVEIKLPFPSYYLLLHNIFKGMNYRSGADKAMKKTISLNPKAKYHYQHGLFLKSQKIWWQATEAFAKAIELSPYKSFKAYCEYADSLEQMNRLGDSITAWKNADNFGKLNCEQYYRYGYVLYKNNSIKESDTIYEKAILLDNSKNSSKLGIGIFHEKRGLWEAARNAYKQTTEQQPNNAEVHYRLGLAHDRCYDWKSAENAFLTAVSICTDSPHYYYRLGFVYERMKEWGKAESAYKQALDRQENHIPDWFFRLGYTLTQQGKNKEATLAFLEQRIIQEPHGVLETQYAKNKHLKSHVDYTEYYERLSLEEETILYESFHAKTISCNPYAIFKSLLHNERFAKFKHIWAINDKSKIPEDLLKYQNIIFIRRNCDAYRRYLAKAKYLINNVTFPDYFIRKKGQVYLNTWHGTPVKSLGKDIKDDFMAHKNVARNFLHATHLIQPNSYTTNILLDRYDIKNTITAQVAETGYPRQDLALNISKNKRKRLQDKLQITSNKKAVLYAPTWRGDHGSAKINTKKLQDDLKEIASMRDIHLLFRGHHLIENLLQEENIETTVVPPEIDSNTLLSVIDILITDYSSIAFDYMALNKPIIYYVYDRKEYEKERGLYFPLEELGGKICYTTQELSRALVNTIKDSSIDIRQEKSKKKFCPYDDGQATNRVIDFTFFNKTKAIKALSPPRKQSILIYGGPFIPNGITTSYINLLNHLDTDKYSVSIVVDSNLLKTLPERVEQLDKVKGHIAILGRGGQMLTTLEEKWCIEKFHLQNKLANEEMFILLQKSYAREFLRVFGHGRFDSIINFEGYNTLWAAIFSVKQNDTEKNSIYLHNDMYEELRLRFPYLQKNFKLYSSYDSLISVSQKTMENNLKNLALAFDLDETKFGYCDNLQNPEDALLRSKEKLENENDNAIFQDSIVFINIARLSPEKDQEKLIRSFKRLYEKQPNSKLIILGSGPLEHHLNKLIVDLKLHKSIYLLGQKSNPYPYLKMSNCFILSSNHEGQPMTLFEALILKKPIIATDIVGNRSVLEGRPGQLVKNSEDGLYQGMLGFIQGEYNSDSVFNYDEYNQNAMDSFIVNNIGRDIK